MRLQSLLSTLLLLATSCLAAEVTLSDAQQQFRAELNTRVAELEKKNASVFGGPDGWLFLAGELRFLAKAEFWGEKAKSSGRGKAADPLPAILDFHRQLKERGIELVLVPVPPKAATYPEKFSAAGGVTIATAPYLRAFYDELRAGGVEVVDLMPLFTANREHDKGAVFCQTDSHWSGVGCMLAAQAIGERVKAKLPPTQPRREFATEWKDTAITGDLVALLGRDAAKPSAETIALRLIAEKGTGAAVKPDPNSPVLIMGDSHTLVFSEFLAQRAGLVDQLAAELGFAPDLIGTRGSGATAVRISLYRKARGDAGYLAKKRVVVWCFAAREFTETDQGWVPQPIAK
jgi:alginate O-acetyltransferase complex protein AlgJ